MIIKKALIVSLIWCFVMNLTGFILLFLGLRDPGGYIRPVNPFWLTIFTYPFFFAAVVINLLIKRKTKINKWLSAFGGVFIVYVLIIIPLIMDNEYFESLDWRVPIFLIAQTTLLVLFDLLVEKWVLKKGSS